MTHQTIHADEIVEQESVENDLKHLSEEETKKFLTPFAFKMDKSLFGLPLASPRKRGIALLIDLALIALLSDISGTVLALAIAITLYRLGNKKRAQAVGKTNGRKRRGIMRFIAATMVFIVLLDTLPPLFKYFDAEEANPSAIVADTELSLGQSLVIAAYAVKAITTIADSDCANLTCWQKELDSVASTMAIVSIEGEIDLSSQQLNDIFIEASDATKLSEEEQAQLVTLMHAVYIEAITENDALLNEGKKFDEDKALVLGNDAQLTSTEEVVKAEQQQKPVYSIIKWVKGIIEDLGLGFGWATFYFTAFIALGNGQTLGKKLLGIKVLQLDGTPLSIWDSFERYGGYGAGIATGLLGFIQIYWDPNRQAIHDKISATVVIDIRKARLPSEVSVQNITE